MLRSRRGDTGREVLLCFIFLGLGIYLGYVFGIPHYNHWALKGRAAEIGRQSPYSDEQIRSTVLEEAARIGVPVNPENVRISRTPKRNILIDITWTEDVYIFGYYMTSYDFRIHSGSDSKF